MRATAAAMKEPGHAVVFYESLVGDVEGTMRTLSRILGLEFETGMKTPADRASFTASDEEWKTGVNAPVEAASSKFEELFDEATQAWINRRLDSDILERLKEKASGAPGGVLSSGHGWG